MTAPDYSSYTQAQLQQVLGRIDAQRYPERVQEIEARLAASNHAGTPEAVATPSGLAPLWRRLLAFMIDALLLGAVGLVAGAILHAQFAAMGAWGVMVGFAIAVLYFGLMQSRLRGGQSVGMLLMNLRLVLRNGQAPGVPAAFLRAGIFCLAYFLNGTWINLPAAYQWLGIPAFVLVAVLIFSVAYLLLFNRRTHQSLHDLAIGAFVVRAGTPADELPASRLWRGHLVMIALAAVLAAAGATRMGGKFFPGQDVSAKLASATALLPRLAAVPGVERAGVVMQTMYASGSAQPAHYYVVQGVIDQAQPDPAAIARHLAQVVLDHGDEAARQDAIIVTLSWGYDIGIARSWHSTQFVETPAKWRQLTGGPAPAAN